jgi:DNA-binding CsgD family transcriptional regulator
MTGTRGSMAPALPLVGRTDELAVLRSALQKAAAGAGQVAVLRAPVGSGRSRLCETIRDEADRKSFLTATGRASPLESGVPYALFCDLLEPLLRRESADTLTALTRGAEEFRLLTPTLAHLHPAASGLPAIGGADVRNRLLWNFPSFLDRLRRERPLLLILEDLEWADPSSVELVHFLGRRIAEIPGVLLLSIDSDQAGGEGSASQAVHSLVSRSGAALLQPRPLAAAEVEQAVSEAFGVAPEVVRPFAHRLHRWTGGNPLFVQETLDALVDSGHLNRRGDRWTGWNLHHLVPSGSVRDLIVQRLDSLSPQSREVADLAAVLGIRVRFEPLRRAAGLGDAELLRALEEVERVRILSEGTEAGEVVYLFQHPVVQDVLIREIGLARARILHGRVARSLEEIYGEAAAEHAEEIAVHILQAGREVPSEKGATLLATAGREALRTHANREAIGFLAGALRLLPREAGTAHAERLAILPQLARAHQRIGAYAEADEILQEARALAEAAGDEGARARILRRLGLGAFWAGEPRSALAYWDEALRIAQGAGKVELEARIRLAASTCLQDLARHEEALSEATAALRLGEEVDSDRIRVAAHRTLLLLHTWSGPPDLAHQHGEAALALANRLADPMARFSVHWAMAVLEGLTGHAEGVRCHLDAAATIADEMESPLAQLLLAEIEIQYAEGLGHWDRGVDLASEAIDMARELNQRLILARILVASGMLDLGRGDMEDARARLDEAWELARAGAGGEAGPGAAHLAILAHAGRAALLSSEGQFDESARVAEAGLALADRGGYLAWGVHRLLPTLAIALLHLRDLEGAARATRKLRHDAERMQHRLGLIWADAADGFIAWLSGDSERAAKLMAEAAARLEEVESIPDAARLRRQLAGRLAEIGERDAAIRELRRVHDILARIGAEPELDKARGQFREVGARPPSRGQVPGSGLLSAREVEIARFVAARKSNKTIARELGISPRTVGTHLSNIFRKLEVDSRAELGDRVREGGL